MATVAAAPFSLNGLVLEIGADDYSLSVNSAEFVPTTTTYSWTNIRGTVYNFPGSTSWVLNLAGAQDWKSVQSFTQYARDNAGQTKTVTVTPQDGGQAFEAEVVIQPTNIGGAVNTAAAFTVGLQVQGDVREATE